MRPARRRLRGSPWPGLRGPEIAAPAPPYGVRYSCRRLGGLLVLTPLNLDIRYPGSLLQPVQRDESACSVHEGGRNRAQEGRSVALSEAADHLVEVLQCFLRPVQRCEGKPSIPNRSGAARGRLPRYD